MSVSGKNWRIVRLENEAMFRRYALGIEALVAHYQSILLDDTVRDVSEFMSNTATLIPHVWLLLIEDPGIPETVFPEHVAGLVR